MVEEEIRISPVRGIQAPLPPSKHLCSHTVQHDCPWAQVGPGVKQLYEGDVVLPAHTFMGTWRSACGSTKETDLIRLPPHLTALITDRYRCRGCCRGMASPSRPFLA